MQLQINCRSSRRPLGYHHPLIHLLLLVLAFAATGHAAGASSELEQGFRHPPESARPWVYWFVMDGNLTREGITADFEALKLAGIGGLWLNEPDVTSSTRPRCTNAGRPSRHDGEMAFP